MGFPPAQPHGALEELFDDVFFVSGGVSMPGPLPMSFSRNMTVLRQGESLTLVNTMRLSEDGLRSLDALGKVERVLRLCGFHGLDDPFYKDRYGAEVWAIEGQRYARGFNANKPDAKTYFEPDVRMTADTDLGIEGASLFVFETSSPPEGMLVLEREGGIVLSGDALQNWATTDEFFSLPAKIVMKLMGFIKPHNVGPGWLREAKPDRAEVRRVLDLEFEHLLPVHGAAVLGGAKAKFRPAIERVT